ncbi:hypothetical protein, partial [Allobacillus halotolerans]|uniref:hypothetical protein n=1 Tax=Allobacillus halotolerans TaxID=570278 RepID=UPI001C1E22AA
MTAEVGPLTAQVGPLTVEDFMKTIEVRPSAQAFVCELSSGWSALSGGSVRLSSGWSALSG